LSTTFYSSGALGFASRTHRRKNLGKNFPDARFARVRRTALAPLARMLALTTAAPFLCSFDDSEASRNVFHRVQIPVFCASEASAE
jgi:hypothetical protein